MTDLEAAFEAAWSKAWKRPSNITLVIHSSPKSSSSAARKASPAATGGAERSPFISSSSRITGVESFV